MTDEALLAVLTDVVAAVRVAVDAIEDRLPPGVRPGQYALDLVADDVALPILDGAGLGVLSEESGVSHGEREVMVCIDPIDGSTNASHRLPWYATSLCALDDDGPRVSLVVNQATGDRFDAVRGGGARHDGEPIRPSTCQSLGQALVGLQGFPTAHLGWKQSRDFGAAALDLCAVAAGRLDAYIACTRDAHGPWDYLGAMLVCAEAGASIVDAWGRDLETREWTDRRTPLAAGTPELLAEVVAARGRLG